MTARVLIICALVMGIAADATWAASVEIVTDGDGVSQVVRYLAWPGERNDLSFELLEESWPTAFVIRDPGATISVGPECVSVDAHTAVCVSSSGAMYHLRAQLGDGDDVLHPAGFELVWANGGP